MQGAPDVTFAVDGDALILSGYDAEGPLRYVYVGNASDLA